MKYLYKPATMLRKPDEGGVVLLFTLIVLVVLLMGGVAVMRSMNSSLFTAGNLAFKRDLLNQGEQAISNVQAAFNTGALSTAASTVNSLASANYSAVQLNTNPRGIPLPLLSNSASPSGLDVQGTNFIPTGAAIAGIGGVSMRYIIDRMCNNTGTASALGETGCVRLPSSTEVRGGTASPAPRPPSPPSLIYRLTVRVDGPRDTQVFLQTSFTKPD
jgi:type II secretory pathway pseudopilin PulG